MTADKDIVERLRAITERYPGFRNLLTDATDEIDSLRAQLAAERAEVDAAKESLSCPFCLDTDCRQCPDHLKMMLVGIAEQAGKRNWFNVVSRATAFINQAMRELRADLNPAATDEARKEAGL